MKRLMIAAAAAAGMAFAPAQAAYVDFAAEADMNGERGLASGDSLKIDGVTMLLFGFGPVGAASPYLDAGKAGLGVCQVLDIKDQCAPASDDNVTEDESVLILFTSNDLGAALFRDLNGLVFRDAKHNLIDDMNDGLVRIVTDNGDMTALFTTFIAMAAGGDAFFEQTSSIFFEFVDKQFYVSAMDVSDIPIPGALPLLLSGIAGLGFASRRKAKFA